MEFKWFLNENEEARLRAFIDAQSSNRYVVKRIEVNVADPPSNITREEFWKVQVGCLLSSQQRSGPESPIARFLRTKPFPLPYDFFANENHAQPAAQKVLIDFGGIRFTKRIPEHLCRNHYELEKGLWHDTERVLERLIVEHSPESERTAAEFIRRRYVGFGPKQSRNLLQSLGLTKYEIPIDSRVIRWLNDFGCPMVLSTYALSDPHYYDFLADGIQQISEQCEIYPCVLDAAIFSSYDGEGWTDENSVW